MTIRLFEAKMKDVISKYAGNPSSGEDVDFKKKSLRVLANLNLAVMSISGSTVPVTGLSGSGLASWGELTSSIENEEKALSLYDWAMSIHENGLKGAICSEFQTIARIAKMCGADLSSYNLLTSKSTFSDIIEAASKTRRNGKFVLDVLSKKTQKTSDYVPTVEGVMESIDEISQPDVDPSSFESSGASSQDLERLQKAFQKVFDKVGVVEYYKLLAESNIITKVAESNGCAFYKYGEKDKDKTKKQGVVAGLYTSWCTSSVNSSNNLANNYKPEHVLVMSDGTRFQMNRDSKTSSTCMDTSDSEAFIEVARELRRFHNDTGDSKFVEAVFKVIGEKGKEKGFFVLHNRDKSTIDVHKQSEYRTLIESNDGTQAIVEDDLGGIYIANVVGEKLVLGKKTYQDYRCLGDGESVPDSVSEMAKNIVVLYGTKGNIVLRKDKFIFPFKTAFKGINQLGEYIVTYENNLEKLFSIKDIFNGKTEPVIEWNGRIGYELGSIFYVFNTTTQEKTWFDARDPVDENGEIREIHPYGKYKFVTNAGDYVVVEMEGGFLNIVRKSDIPSNPENVVFTKWKKNIDYLFGSSFFSVSGPDNKHTIVDAASKENTDEIKRKIGSEFNNIRVNKRGSGTVIVCGLKYNIVKKNIEKNEYPFVFDHLLDSSPAFAHDGFIVVSEEKKSFIYRLDSNGKNPKRLFGKGFSSIYNKELFSFMNGDDDILVVYDKGYNIVILDDNPRLVMKENCDTIEYERNSLFKVKKGHAENIVDVDGDGGFMLDKWYSAISVNDSDGYSFMVCKDERGSFSLYSLVKDEKGMTVPRHEIDADNARIYPSFVSINVAYEDETFNMILYETLKNGRHDFAFEKPMTRVENVSWTNDLIKSIDENGREALHCLHVVDSSNHVVDLVPESMKVFGCFFDKFILMSDKDGNAMLFNVPSSGKTTKMKNIIPEKVALVEEDSSFVVLQRHDGTLNILDLSKVKTKDPFAGLMFKEWSKTLLGGSMYGVLASSSGLHDVSVDFDKISSYSRFINRKKKHESRAVRRCECCGKAF